MNDFIKKIRLALSYLAGHKRQVTAAVLEKDGRFLIARRMTGKALGGKWEFPGGKVEPGETPEECLRREIKEEFDIDIEVKEHIVSSVFRYCFVPIELAAYRVRYIGGKLKVKDHEEIRWASKDELNTYDFMEADKPVVSLLASA